MSDVIPDECYNESMFGIQHNEYTLISYCQLKIRLNYHPIKKMTYVHLALQIIKLNLEATTTEFKINTTYC